MRILVIEDDERVLGYIKKGFEEAGHAVDIAADGETGLHLATSEHYSAIVLDRMLPKMDGLEVVRALRGTGNLTGVLILSALGDVDDRVSGLRSGGDDYLVKPFAFAELLARVEGLGLRSRQGGQAKQTTLTAQDVEMDLLARKVMRGGAAIELQTREFRLLEYLLKHKGQVVTRTMLLESVWDYHFDPQTSVIDVHISRLRKKLGDQESKLIRTVRGAGYIIDA